MSQLSRRSLLALLPLTVAACATQPMAYVPPPAPPAPLDPNRPRRYPLPAPEYQAMYGAVDDGQFVVPAVDLTLINPAFLRAEVPFQTDFPPGTIIIDTPARYLYLVEPDGYAMRYGVGVGREGFSWNGEAVIRRKSEWPKWFPPVEMQARDPEAAKWSAGMPGGLTNPLGARAHYLYQGDVDTLYRIHGTSQPWTIGTNVSSGCIRMINQDVMDLYDRVPVGTRVVVLPAEMIAPPA